MKKLTALVKLLDDDSQVVRDAVRSAVQSYGADLPQVLNQLEAPPTPQQNKMLQSMIMDDNRARFKSNTERLFRGAMELKTLEAFLSELALFQSNVIYRQDLSGLLDGLAHEFKRTHTNLDAYKLATFLFRTTGIKGVGKDYHNPMNCNLVYVIKEKKGIAISLTLLYILVGHRLGMTITGCNYPGHFLAKVGLKEKDFFVDCFHGGRFLDEADILSGDTPWVLRKTLQKNATVAGMMECVLSHLANAYQRIQSDNNRSLMNALRRTLEPKLNAEKPRKTEGAPGST